MGSCGDWVLAVGTGVGTLLLSLLEKSLDVTEAPIRTNWVDGPGKLSANMNAFSSGLWPAPSTGRSCSAQLLGGPSFPHSLDAFDLISSLRYSAFSCLASCWAVAHAEPTRAHGSVYMLALETLDDAWQLAADSLGGDSVLQGPS